MCNVFLSYNTCKIQYCDLKLFSTFLNNLINLTLLNILLSSTNFKYSNIQLDYTQLYYFWFINKLKCFSIFHNRKYFSALKYLNAISLYRSRFCLWARIPATERKKSEKEKLHRVLGSCTYAGSAPDRCRGLSTSREGEFSLVFPSLSSPSSVLEVRSVCTRLTFLPVHRRARERIHRPRLRESSWGYDVLPWGLPPDDIAELSWKSQLHCCVFFLTIWNLSFSNVPPCLSNKTNCGDNQVLKIIHVTHYCKD